MFKKIFTIIFVLTNFCVLAMHVNETHKRKEIEREIDDENESNLHPARKKPRIVPADIQIDFEAEEELIKDLSQEDLRANMLINLAAKKVAIKAALIYDQRGYDEFKNYLEELLDDVKMVVFDLLINELNREDIFINKIKEIDSQYSSYFILEDLLSVIDSLSDNEMEKEKSLVYYIMQDLFRSFDRKLYFKDFIIILKQKIEQTDEDKDVNLGGEKFKDADNLSHFEKIKDACTSISTDIRSVQTKIWDIETGQCILTVHGRVRLTSMSNDNENVAGSFIQPKIIKICDVEPEESINTLTELFRSLSISDKDKLTSIKKFYKSKI